MRLVSLSQYFFAVSKRLKVNYPSDILSSRENHLHLMETSFNYGFFTFTTLFTVLFASNYITDGSFVIDSDDSVQERLLFPS